MRRMGQATQTQAKAEVYPPLAGRGRPIRNPNFRIPQSTADDEDDDEDEDEGC